MPTHGRNHQNNNHNYRKQRSKGHGDSDHRGHVSRTDESHSDSYPRMSRSSESTYKDRTSSVSRISSYEMAREPSSSSLPDWRSESGHDSYDYPSSGDGYRRAARDDYEMLDSRDSEGWGRPSAEVQYSQTRGDDWTDRYPYNASYQEPPPSTSWNANSYDDRRPSYDYWSKEPGGTLDRPPGSPQWKQGGKEAGRWQNDPGWDSRRREHHVEREPEPPRYEFPPDTLGDRSWQPAASWRDSQDYRSQNSQRYSNSGSSTRHSKGGKRTQQNQAKQKRDWRADDGLNNWTRRDNHDRVDKTVPPPRKHHRSLSRSRSPAQSLQSHRSSRGRSRSRSPTPPTKRRRREATPPTVTNTPVKATWDREPPDESRPGRRRSISSASSNSSRRSHSRSPERPRAVHRLPSTSSAIHPPLSYPPSIGQGQADSAQKRNGKNHANGKNKRNKKQPQNQQSHELGVPEGFPSPKLLTARSQGHVPEAPLVADPSLRQTLFGPNKASPSLTSLPSAKNAGFKPIGQATSSLRRFFPGDDDDVESPQNEASHVGKRPQDTSSSGWKYELPSHDFFEEPPPPGLSARAYGYLRPPVAAESSNSVETRPEDLHAELSQRPTRDHPFHSHPTTPSVTDQTSVLKGGHPPPATTPSSAVQSTNGDETPAHPPPSAVPAELYSIVNQVGEGTFGKVYKARNNATSIHVALKRIRMESEKDGFPVTAMREIKLLQSLRHNNIVRLFEMMTSNSAVYMVFEYMDHDLTGVLSQSHFTFSDAHLKSLCHQMLAGLAYLHHKGVIHRDIKGSNILLNNRGELKLADFGLARFYQKRRRADYTNRVITLWYRPPELLFGATVYGPEVDMWSAGCIMLELYTKKPVFQGNDEIHQLDVIYKILGTPTPERWPDVLSLPWYELVKPKDAIPNHFRDLFQKWMSPAALDLAEKLLSYDPSHRATAVQAMETPYFTQEQPSPEMPVGLATLEGEWHELETKRERARKRKKEELGGQ